LKLHAKLVGLVFWQGHEVLQVKLTLLSLFEARCLNRPNLIGLFRPMECV